MVKTIHAIYEHGVLRPLEPIKDIKENSEVEITVAIQEKASHPFLRFAGILNEEEADKMIKIVEDEFEKVNPDEW